MKRDERLNKVFSCSFIRTDGKAILLTADDIVPISCLFEPAVLGAMNLSNIIPVKPEAWIPPPPRNYQATAGSICVCQRMGLIYRFCQSSPHYLPRTEKQATTKWSGQCQTRWQPGKTGRAHRFPTAEGERENRQNLRQKSLRMPVGLPVLPCYKKYNFPFNPNM